MIDCKSDKRQVLKVAHRYKLVEPAFLMPYFETKALTPDALMVSAEKVIERGMLPVGTEIFVVNVACKKKHSRLWYKVRVGDEEGWLNSASLVCEEING